MRDSFFSVEREEEIIRRKNGFRGFQREGKENGKKGKESRKKCENKAISWIKWDVTGGKTVLYALTLSRFLPLSMEGWKKKRREENYIFEIRGWNGWCSYLGVVENVCKYTKAKRLSSEQAIIGTWEIGESLPHETTDNEMPGSMKKGGKWEKSVRQYKLGN
jgi:hypothetical protein